MKGDFVDIEGPPSTYCAKRIEHGLVSKKKWKQGWNNKWFKSVARKSMKESAEQIREEILRIDTLIEKSKKDIEEAEKKRDSLIEQLLEKGFLLYEKDIVYHGNPDPSVEDIHVGDILILTGWSHNCIISFDSVVVVGDNDKSEIPLFVRCIKSGETDWVGLESVKRL